MICFDLCQQMMGIETSDRMGQVIAQLSSFSEGLDAIRGAVTESVETLREEPEAKVDEPAAELVLAEESMGRLEKLLSKTLTDMRPAATKKQPSVVETHLSADTLKAMAGMIAKIPQAAAGPVTQGGAAKPSTIQIVTKLPRVLLQVIHEQLKLFQKWLDPILSQSSKNSLQLKGQRESLVKMVGNYKASMSELDKTRVEEPDQVQRKSRIRKPRRRK